MKAQDWTVSDTTNAKYLGLIEFLDESGEWHNFEMLRTKNASATPNRIVFGGACNTGFIESGYMEIEDGETTDEALSECLSDLECYYNNGPEYVSRIICNERM